MAGSIRDPRLRGESTGVKLGLSTKSSATKVPAVKTVDVASKLKMPAIGLGTWKMDDGVATGAVKTALDVGYKHIDCAAIYLNEHEVGEAFSSWFGQGGKRDDLWITSKLWNDCHQTEHVEAALKKSLSDLQIDELDLYLIHWPIAQKHGVLRVQSGDDFIPINQVPISDTWQAMEDCVKKGLCKSIGVSNFSQSKLQPLLDNATIKPAVNQVEAHPFFPQDELLNFCRSNDIAFTGYSPLGSGDRPDRMRADADPNLFEDETIKSLAAERNISPGQVILAWAVNRGTVPIPKSSNESRLKENLAAAEIEFSPEEMSRIAEANQNYRFVHGKFWEMEGGPYLAEEIWA